MLTSTKGHVARLLMSFQPQGGLLDHEHMLDVTNITHKKQTEQDCGREALTVVLMCRCRR